MYNVNDAESTAMQLIAPGVYPAVITDWTVKASEHVGYKVAFQIVGEGAYKNRYVQDYLILEHANEVAQKIGFGRIADIAFAAGVQSWGSEHELTAMLMGKEIMLEVIKARDNRDGSDQNRVKTAYTLDGKNRSGHKMRTNAAQPTQKYSSVGKVGTAQDTSDLPF